MKGKLEPLFLKLQGVLIGVLGLVFLSLAWLARYALMAIERALSTCWFCG